MILEILLLLFIMKIVWNIIFIYYPEWKEKKQGKKWLLKEYI